MGKKAVSKRMIEKAVAAINEYYDKGTGGYLPKEFLIKKGICSENNVDVLISRLVGLKLITYSSTKNRDEIGINRLEACTVYFEKKNEAIRQASFAKITSIISLIVSLISLTLSIIKFLVA